MSIKSVVFTEKNERANALEEAAVSRQFMGDIDVTIEPIESQHQLESAVRRVASPDVDEPTLQKMTDHYEKVGYVGTRSLVTLDIINDRVDLDALHKLADENEAIHAEFSAPADRWIE